MRVFSSSFPTSLASNYSMHTHQGGVVACACVCVHVCARVRVCRRVRRRGCEWVVVHMQASAWARASRT